MYGIVNLVNLTLQSFDVFCPIKIRWNLHISWWPQESRAALARILGLTITAKIRMYHDVDAPKSRRFGEYGLSYPEMVNIG